MPHIYLRNSDGASFELDFHWLTAYLFEGGLEPYSSGI